MGPVRSGRYGIVSLMPGSSAAGVVVVGASIAGLRACETLRTDGYARHGHAGRRRAAPALRPPAAVQEAARRRLGARPHRAAPPGRVRHDRPRRAPRRAGRRARHRRPRRRARRRHDGAVRRRAWSSPPARRTQRLPGQEAVADRPRAAHARGLARPARSGSPTATARVVVVGAGFIGLEVAATARAPRLRGDRARRRCRRR